jgi:L-lactate utilization protein LutC
MKTWDEKATRDVIEMTMKALTGNGIEAFYAADREEAKKKVLSFIPEGSEVFTLSSITLDETGIAKEINESGRYNSVRNALNKLDRKTQMREQRKLGAAPDFAIGSAHAVTEGGTLVIASLTGSQLPAIAFAGGTMIWVVGAQKIVKDMEQGFARLHEYVVPKESGRARKAYGLPEFNTFPSKILLFNREFIPGRAKLILVDEVLGF